MSDSINPVPSEDFNSSDPPTNNSDLLDTEEPKFFNIIVKTPETEITLQISLADNVQDIKQLLLESKECCCDTSYALLFNGIPINNFAELQTIEGLQESSILTMEQRPYSQFESRLHINRLQEVLNDSNERPFSLLSSLTSQLEQEMTQLAEQNTFSKKTQSTKKGKKGKKNRKPKKQNNHQDKAQNILKSQLPLSPDFENHLGNFFPPLKKKIECLHSISYSAWNPPPGSRVCKGDLSYITVHTLEDKIFHLTSTRKGFYVNNSTATTFDPLPATKSSFSHSLVDVIKQISPLFKSQFELLLENLFSAHPFETIPVPHEELNVPWLNPAHNHTHDVHRSESFLSGDVMNQFPHTIRDWNAEYQSCKELPSSTLQERIIRDRSIIKVTNDFTSSAIAGAKAIVNGAVQSINPTDPPAAQLFIHNNIFFSKALNGRYLFDEGTGDMGPYKLVNNDFNGVQAYNLINIPELHTVLTVLVNYQGYRFVAQSIIPGILLQSSTDCIKYGSSDHGKSLVWDEDFHTVMMKAAKELKVPEHEIKDENGNVVKLCCATETKGVLGTDGRKYVLDIDRGTVKDPNFPEDWALLRFELYEHFTEWKRHEHVLKNKDKYKYLQETIRRAVNRKESKEPEGGQPENPDESAEIPAFVEPTFNPNACGLNHCTLVGDEELIREAENQVKELGKFLMDSMVPLLANEIVNNRTFPSDSVTLTNLFHSHGVNMRYLGAVAKQLQSKKPFARQLMIREMIVRSTKHIFNEFMRNSLSEGEYADGISHLLNCFVRGAFMRNSNQPTKAPLESHVPESYSLTPLKLWEQIEEQVKSQFHFELSKKDFQAAEYALPAIRTLCQKTGISIRARQYDMYSHQPFSSDDIMGLFPVVKMPTVVNKDAERLVEAGKNYLGNGRVDIAFEFFTEALQIFHQTHGPMHLNTAQCYSHLAMVLNHIGNHTHALIHQTKAIIILERTAGLDFYQTAFEYGNLGLFYHQATHAPLAFGFLKRSLYLSTLIGGPNHPDNAAALMNIAAILQDNKDYKTALEFYKRAVVCFDFNFGTKHVNTAVTNHNLALCYAHLDNFRSALNYEKKSFEILSELFGENDPRTEESNSFLKQFTEKAVKVEKQFKHTQKRVVSNSKPEKNHSTDDCIGTLPIGDIMKYINNNERSKPRSTYA